MSEEQKTEWQEMREGFHHTYNGGHREQETREAFHHGMDTVFNALEKLPPPSLCRAASEMFSLLQDATSVVALGAAATATQKYDLLARLYALLAVHIEDVHSAQGGEGER